LWENSPPTASNLASKILSLGVISPLRICFPFVLPASSLSRRLPPYSRHGQIPEENRPLERLRGSPAIAAARRASGRQRLRLGTAVGGRGRGVGHRDAA